MWNSVREMKRCFAVCRKVIVSVTFYCNFENLRPENQVSSLTPANQGHSKCFKGEADSGRSVHDVADAGGVGLGTLQRAVDEEKSSLNSNERLNFESPDKNRKTA
jgi:hypothetical protein